MRLTKIKIDSFKRVKSVEFDLADVNILVGVNGSGKSSIIQAIHLACCVMRQADRVEKGGTSTVGIEELEEPRGTFLSMFLTLPLFPYANLHLPSMLSRHALKPDLRRLIPSVEICRSQFQKKGTRKRGQIYFQKKGTDLFSGFIFRAFSGNA